MLSQLFLGYDPSVRKKEHDELVADLREHTDRLAEYRHKLEDLYYEEHTEHLDYKGHYVPDSSSD